MTRKPRSEWSDAYRKRIESYERRNPGATKQQARGQGKAKHQLGGESEYQKRTRNKTRRLFEATPQKRAARPGQEAPLSYGEIDDLIAEVGPAKALELAVRRQRIQQMYAESRYGYTEEYYELVEDYEGYDIDIVWFNYH